MTAITSASSYVIKNSDPYPSASASSSSEPPPLPPRALVLLTSERTRKGLATVHAMSGQAVQVSAKTITLVDSMIKRAVGRKEKSKDKTSMSTSTLSLGTSSMSRGRSPSPLPSYSEKPTLPPRKGDISSSPAQRPPLPPRSGSGSEAGAVGTKDRLILSAALILSTIDNSAKQILDVGSKQLNAVVEHKWVDRPFFCKSESDVVNTFRYGADAARSTALLTGTAQNVGLVYIDMRGIGRKALVKRAGKEYIKNHFSKSGGEK